MPPDCLSTIQFAQIAVRGSALLLVSIGGMVCIYLGWRLYQSAMSSAVAGELSVQGLSLKLSAASPGVFLAAFGAYLLFSVAQHRFLDKSHEEEAAAPSAHGSTVEHTTHWMAAQAATPPAAPSCTCPAQRECLLVRKKTSETSYIGGSADATLATLREDLSSMRALLANMTPSDQAERIRQVKATQALARLEALAADAAQEAQ